MKYNFFVIAQGRWNELWIGGSHVRNQGEGSWLGRVLSWTSHQSRWLERCYIFFRRTSSFLSKH